MTLSPEILAWGGADYDVMPATQLALLDAAAKAFTTHGYATASIDLIASQIGATKGSVYYHYRSKGELFFAVHKRAMAINLKAQIPIVQDRTLDPATKLERMAGQHAMLMMETLYYQRVTVQGIDLHRSLSTTPMEREALAEVVAMRDAYEGLFVRVLEQGARQAVFDKVDAALAAKSILGSLNWITVWYRPRDTETHADRHRVAAQLARQAVFGVSRQEGVAVRGTGRKAKPAADARAPARKRAAG